MVPRALPWAYLLRPRWGKAFALQANRARGMCHGPVRSILAAPRRVRVKFVGEHLPINRPASPLFDAPRRPADNVLGIGFARAIRRRTLPGLGGKGLSAPTALCSLSNHYQVGHS
jgi:hypothetical protein